MKTINKIQETIARISLLLAGIGLATIVMAVIYAVLCRFVFKANSIWVEQYSRYMLIWVAMLAANVLIRRNELMRVDFLDHMWPVRAMKVREGIYSVLFVVILGVLFWQGWLQARSYWGVQVVGLPVDRFWVYACIPVGTFLMLLQYFLNLVKAFMKDEGKKEGVGI